MSNDALVRGGLSANIWRDVYRFSRGPCPYTTEFITPPTWAEHNVRSKAASATIEPARQKYP